MRYRYYFCDKCESELVDFLNKNNISYKVSGEDSFLPLVIFNLWSTTENLNYYFEELQKMNVNSPIMIAEFSASELSNAKLLVMTPKKQCIDILNDEAYEYTCKWTNSSGEIISKHEEQKELFVIKKEPSSNSQTAFWAESTGFSEIFTDYRVYELANSNSLTGIDFKNVILKNRDFSKHIYQMSSKNKLNNQCIVFGYGEKRQVCEICGKEQYFIDNAYQLHLDFDKIQTHSDLYVTERIFGEGIAYPLYIISQRFYQLLKKHKLVGGVTFSPIVEASNPTETNQRTAL